MKISRSAIAIVIAIVLLLTAVFVMRPGDPASIPEDGSSQDNATAVITASPDPTDSLISAQAPATAASTDQSELDAALHSNNATPISSNSTALPADESSAPADNAVASANSTAAPAEESTAQAGAEPKEAAAASDKAAAPAAEALPLVTETTSEEPLPPEPEHPVALAGAAGIAAINSIFEQQAQAVLEAIAAEAERLENIALAKEKAEREKAELAAREKAEKEKAEKAAKEKAERELATQQAQQQQAQQQQAQQQQTRQAAPQPPVALAPTTPAIVGGAPADVMNKLLDFGSQRVHLINRSIQPSKNSREIVRDGEAYVARYYYVEPGSLSIEAIPADPNSPFKYIGKVRYRECLYEVRGSSREEAMNGEGAVVTQRNMCELIQYKNNKWLE